VTADAGAIDIYLGRPWRPYSTVVFLNTDLQAQIEQDGWREWHPGETHSLETATYAEFHSGGPGAAAAHREPHALQLSRAEANVIHLEHFWRALMDGIRPEFNNFPAIKSAEKDRVQLRGRRVNLIYDRFIVFVKPIWCAHIGGV
jgi:Pectinesterase